MSRRPGRAYEEISVGETAQITRQVTRRDVDRFAELTGDDNPLHMDPGYAESTPFMDVVVHGMLSASLLSTLVGTELPGAGALWIGQTLNFVHPVRVDDTLTVSGTVTAKHDRERLLELDASIENQSGQIVLTGSGTVKVLDARQEAVAPPAPSKVAVVAGAAGGIGRATCLTLAEEGIAIIAANRRQESRATDLVNEIRAAGGRATAIQADITSDTDVTRLIQAGTREFGPPDVLIHAASPPIGPADFADLRWEEMEAHLQGGVRGAFLLTQACVPHMRDSGYGRIILVTSAVLDGAPTPRWTAYAVGKSALATFGRSLAVELGPAGVTVNCVAPGMTETAMIGDIPEKMRLVLARQTPLRRLAKPDDVARAIAFLVSPAAAYITGETIRVNGGQVTL